MDDRFIRINNKEYSLEEIAKALGIQVEEDRPFEVSLCQRIDAGILVAKAEDDDLYPRIDVELELPEQMRSEPFILSRSVQPRDDDEMVMPVSTYCYDRLGEYFMYVDADVRSDADVKSQFKAPSMRISGDPGSIVDVRADNPYVSFRDFNPAELSVMDRIESLQQRMAKIVEKEPKEVIYFGDGAQITKKDLIDRAIAIANEFIAQISKHNKPDERSITFDFGSPFDELDINYEYDREAQEWRTCCTLYSKDCGDMSSLRTVPDTSDVNGIANAIMDLVQELDIPKERRATIDEQIRKSKQMQNGINTSISDQTPTKHTSQPER